MARPYSEEYLRALKTLDGTRIGVQLGRICVKANLPIMYVARVFGVSRMSVHNWFRGKYVRDKNYTKINEFIAKVETGFKKGMLPVGSLVEAREFIDSIKINQKE